MNQYNMPQMSYGIPPQGPSPQPPEEGPKQKKQRISRACDRCHARSTKCVPGPDRDSPCQTCVNFGSVCTNDRPRQKRGMKAKDAPPPVLRDGESDAKLLLDLVHGPQGDRNRNTLQAQENLKGFAIQNESQIQLLVDAFVELIYPVHPFFHLPTLRRRVQSRDYLRDTTFFAEVMSICALSTVKARDTSLSGPWADTILAIPPETFFLAAESFVPDDLNLLSSLDWMRTCALLSLYGLHVDKLNIMHKYMGTYLSVIAMDALHDEDNWPMNIGIVEVEMRRRLFWSMYSFEVYTATVFGHTIRHRAENANVCDPSEVDDDFFSNQGYNPPGSLAPYHTKKSIVDPLCWLYGWNFNTELSRVLENCINSASSSHSTIFRRQQPKKQPNLNHENNILSSIIPMYEMLHARFKNAPKVTEIGENISSVQGVPDRFEIQAANISTTLQLIRMVLFNSRLTTSDIIDDQHAMASNLIDSLYQIPTLSQKIISTPMLYHFAGVAALLKDVMSGPITDARCRHLRLDLAVIGDIFAHIEQGTASLNPLTNNMNHKIALLSSYISNPQNALAHPHSHSQLHGQPFGTSSSDDAIDPNLHNSTTNNKNNSTTKTHNHSHLTTSSTSPTHHLQQGYNLLKAGSTAPSDADSSPYTHGLRSRYLNYTTAMGGSGSELADADLEVDLYAKGSEEVWFQIPGEVSGDWVWEGVVGAGGVGRGFGRG